jgi:CelD/BcsL family acetyltransferase involved in cellulose biosynthesis
LTVGSWRLDQLTADQVAQWTRLFEEQPGPANPFCSPLWVGAWLRQYVARDDQRITLVLDGDRLIGVAPMHFQQVRAAGVPVARRLAMVGCGRTTPLELPQVLAAPGHARAVVRVVIQHTLAHRVSWSELSLGREQGWFPPGTSGVKGWLPVTFQRHERARACVVLPLADTWEQTRAGLKRNIKESLRRARNRLARDGRPWRIERRTGPAVDAAAVDRLLDLHAARSGYQGSWSHHHNAFADPADRGLMTGLLPQLAAAGEAEIVELEIDSQVVAAQLVLRAPETVYFHSSGFLPQVWELSPITALQAAAIEAGIAGGARWANFSPGPNEAKLRWSEDLQVVDDFAYGGGGRADLARYTGFTLAQEIRMLRLTHHQAARDVAAGPG